MMPHSLCDLGFPAQASSASPSKVIDIKVNQDPKQLFSPGNVVSGYVVFFGAEKKRHFDIEFFGRSRTAFDINYDSYGLTRQYADEAILFSYKRPLNDKFIPGDGDFSQDSHLKFEFRFPSNTENRRQVFYQKALHQHLSDSAHPLPPSLEHTTPHCSFSVEYILRAKVYSDTHLLAETELLLPFSPTRSAAGFSIASPIHSPTAQWPKPPTDETRTRPLRNRSRSVKGSSVMTIYPPINVVAGQAVSIRAELSFNDISGGGGLLVRPFDIQIEELQLLCYTGCRGKRTNYDFTLDNDLEEMACLSGKVNIPAHQPVNGIESLTENTFSFSIDTKLPQRLLPTFRSFIVFNSYSLHARILAKVCGHEHKTCLVIDDIQVVTPPRTAAPNEKPPTPALILTAPTRRR